MERLPAFSPPHTSATQCPVHRPSHLCAPPSPQAALDLSIPLEPRRPSHHLCVARLPAGGDLTAGQHGVWTGQDVPWAGQARMSRSARKEARRAAAAAAGDADAAAGEGPEDPRYIPAASGGSDAAAAAAAAAARSPAERAAVPLELRWSIVPSDWGWLLPADTGARLSFTDAPASAVHKLDEALRVRGWGGWGRSGKGGCLRPWGRCHPLGFAGGAAWPLRAPSGQATGAAASASRVTVCQPPPRPQLLGLAPPIGERPCRWAIDLGASPGAWTQHLAGAYGYSVVAVDPGELAPAVLALPGVHHVRARAENAVGAAVALMAGAEHGGGGGGSSGGDTAADGDGSEGGMAELLVCDMNMHPLDAAKVWVGRRLQSSPRSRRVPGSGCASRRHAPPTWRRCCRTSTRLHTAAATARRPQIMLPLLPLLAPGAQLVVTLKLPGSGRDRADLVSRVAARLVSGGPYCLQRCTTPHRLSAQWVGPASQRACDGAWAAGAWQAAVTQAWRARALPWTARTRTTPALPLPAPPAPQGAAVDADSVKCAWLMSNTACERTLFARRAATLPGAQPATQGGGDSLGAGASATAPSTADVAT